MDMGGTQTKGQKDMKLDDYPQGLTSVRWHKLYVSIKERERELASIEDCIDPSTQGLKDNIKNEQRGLITAANNSIKNINTDSETKKQKWEERQIFGDFKRKTDETTQEKT